MIGSWRPSKLLKDQKHDTHLFVEVNQATNAWSFRQSCVSVCRFKSLHNIRHFCCSEASNFSKLDKSTNCTIILSKGPCTCSLIHFYKEVHIMLLVTLAMSWVFMTKSNSREIYELDFDFRFLNLKLQIFEIEQIHVNDTWNANNQSLYLQ